MEQVDIKDLVKKLEQHTTQKDIIIDILVNIIKQQMLYGGTLADKINYQLDLVEKAINKNK